MSPASAPTSRASLLAGLRTGGVRSTSSPLAAIPHTAAPNASFNVSRSLSHSLSNGEEDQSVPFPHFPNPGPNRLLPSTAAVDGPNNNFAHHQRGMNPNSAPFTPAFGGNIQAQNAHLQAQALQLQMVQLELMRLQTIQAHQYQTELIAYAQRQQNRRPSLPANPPATAGPANGTFDLRAATVSAQMRRANQAEQPKSLAGTEQFPMTAALGGKFGSRTVSGGLSRPEGEETHSLPSTPGSTTVISGGTSLGNLTSINGTATPSKSDAAVSWRRGGNNNSVLSGINRTTSTTSPSVKVTPPPTERVSPPLAERHSPPPATAKTRPVPLRFSAAVSQPLPVVAVDGSPTDSGDPISSSRADDGYSTSSSRSVSCPTTPRSASSSTDMPLSPREEATKKLYEGLGIGRPSSAVVNVEIPAAVPVVSHRLASQPMRQPRGPPSGMDELGPHNFATRLRRKAIGGISAALISARERREIIEAY